MLLKRRLKGGILLYALFMAAVFALLLQFYVARLKASHQVRLATYQQTQASLMAEMTKDFADQDKGSYRFSAGQTSYETKADQMTVTVSLTSGQTYRYEFLVKPKTSDKKEDKQTSDQDSQGSPDKPASSQEGN